MQAHGYGGPAHAAAHPSAGMHAAGDPSQERYVRLLERDIETLRNELKAARERADNPLMMQELRETQDQLREERNKLQDAEHRLRQADDTARRFDELLASETQRGEQLREQHVQLQALEQRARHAEDLARAAEQREQHLEVACYLTRCFA